VVHRLFCPCPALDPALLFLRPIDMAQVFTGISLILPVCSYWGVSPAQVGMERDDYAASLGPNQVVVLVGHTLEFATGGELSATNHRVVVRSRPAQNHSRAGVGWESW